MFQRKGAEPEKKSPVIPVPGCGCICRPEAFKGVVEGDVAEVRSYQVIYDFVDDKCYLPLLNRT